jgi:D-beta-D-heptose 7-phosphate kinase/D-beta-D-heptose 1-phosphate adenosyltransferase
VKLLSRKRGREILGRLPTVRVLVVGDVMLDRFLMGDVARISPEAPVPVVRVTGETVVPGGAGNVAQNLSAMKAGVEVVGVVGDDLAGEELVGLLTGNGTGCGALTTIGGHPTTVKTRIIARGQQLLRADQEADQLILPEAVEAELMDSVRSRIGSVDAILLSDYDKGTLTRPLVSFCMDLAREAGIPLTADPKPPHFLDYCNGATAITPNRHELARFLGDFDINDGDFLAAGRKILRRLGCRAVLITRGQHGMSLVERGKKMLSIPAANREVYDVTGAGDTVIAWFTAALAAGATMREASVLSNMAAGVAVGKVGTTPVHADEMEAIL